MRVSIHWEHPECTFHSRLKFRLWTLGWEESKYGFVLYYALCFFLRRQLGHTWSRFWTLIDVHNLVGIFLLPARSHSLALHNQQRKSGGLLCSLWQVIEVIQRDKIAERRSGYEIRLFNAHTWPPMAVACDSSASLVQQCVCPARRRFPSPTSFARDCLRISPILLSCFVLKGRWRTICPDANRTNFIGNEFIFAMLFFWSNRTSSEQQPGSEGI